MLSISAAFQDAGIRRFALRTIHRVLSPWSPCSDPVKDFVPITRVGSFTLMPVVNPNLPIHSVKEMIDYAKANPGYLTFATGPRQRRCCRRCHVRFVPKADIPAIVGYD